MLQMIERAESVVEANDLSFVNSGNFLDLIMILECHRTNCNESDTSAGCPCEQV